MTRGTLFLMPILEGNTYHNLIWFLQAELEGLLECLGNHAHPLRGEREPTRLRYHQTEARSHDLLDSQALILPQMVGHCPAGQSISEDTQSGAKT